MGTVEATLRARAGRATPPAGRLALAYWGAFLRALNLPVALLHRLAPALRLDPGAFREAAARREPDLSPLSGAPAGRSTAR